MTAEELKKLKQKQAPKGGNIAEPDNPKKCYLTNERDTKKREKRQRSKNEKKCFLRKFALSAKKCFLPFLQQLQIYFKEIKNGIYWNTNERESYGGS